MREPHYLLCFGDVPSPYFPRNVRKPQFLQCFKGSQLEQIVEIGINSRILTDLPLGPPPDSRESLIKTQVEVYSLIKTKAKGLCCAQTQSSSHAGSTDISPNRFICRGSNGLV